MRNARLGEPKQYKRKCAYVHRTNQRIYIAEWKLPTPSRGIIAHINSPQEIRDLLNPVLSFILSKHIPSPAFQDPETAHCQITPSNS